MQPITTIITQISVSRSSVYSHAAHAIGELKKHNDFKAQEKHISSHVKKQKNQDWIVFNHFMFLYGNQKNKYQR